MLLFTIFFLITVTGVMLWYLIACLPMNSTAKKILVITVGSGLIACLAEALGVPVW